MRSVERDPVPRHDVSMATFSTLGVGGTARFFVRAERSADVERAHRWSQDRRASLFVLGGGSNVVIADEGFDGLVLQMASSGSSITNADGTTTVTACAGESWDALVASTVSRGLAGLECLSGIPGTVGGTPIQNVGAYGQEVADTIDSVVVFDRRDASMKTLPAAECGFSYRMSRFKDNDVDRFIVCEVTFRLRTNRPRPSYPDVLAYLDRAGVSDPQVSDVRTAVLAIRRGKGMVIDPADSDTRSVGSFFMNPIVSAEQREQIAVIAGDSPAGFALPDGRTKVAAAWLIERAGFHKGHTEGTVAISTKHPLAIVNRGGACARDVIRLATRIKRQVADRFDVWLRPEPVFVGFQSDRDVDYLQRAGR